MSGKSCPPHLFKGFVLFALQWCSCTFSFLRCGCTSTSCCLLQIVSHFTERQAFLPLFFLAFLSFPLWRSLNGTVAPFFFFFFFSQPSRCKMLLLFPPIPFSATTPFFSLPLSKHARSFTWKCILNFFFRHDLHSSIFMLNFSS